MQYTKLKSNGRIFIVTDYYTDIFIIHYVFHFFFLPKKHYSSGQNMERIQKYGHTKGNYILILSLDQCTLFF